MIRSGLLQIRRLWEGREPLHDTERRLVINGLFPQGTSRREFFTRFASLMMISTAIAVFGILADSTAVVIGAMLVAPLMFPVLGAAAAIVMGWPLRIIRRVLLVAVGSVLAVALAAAISFVVPGRVDPLPLPRAQPAHTVRSGAMQRTPSRALLLRWPSCRLWQSSESPSS